MQYQYNSYVSLLIASTCTTLFLGMYALLKRRNVKGAKSFMLSMFVVTIWSAGNALEMSSLDFGAKLFWANLQYIAYCFSPVTLVTLTMQVTGYNQWVKNKRILWLALLPTIIIILVWTDPMHGLVRYGMHMDYSGPFPVIAKNYGPAFFIHAFYSHSLNILAWVLLIRAVLFKNNLYRKQAAALLCGLSLIILPNILYITGLSPVQRFDITPIFFGPAGLIIAWGIFRYKLLDVVPVARATIIESMDAGIMVLDLQNRILDINPAFEKIVALPASMVLSRKVEEVCGKIPELLKACTDESKTYREFSMSVNELSRVYEVLLFPLTDAKGVLIGRLFVTYDITERKQVQREYMMQQWKLAVNEERIKLARDMHDNLGQVLGFINLQAQGIRQELSNAGIEIALPEIDRLVKVAQSAQQEIREYIRNTRSSTAIENNFSTALTKDIMNFEEQTGLMVELDIPKGFTGEELELNVRLNLLNIIKEALNNIRKHAEAKHVKIAFSFVGNQLCATVEDDGKGFDIVRHNHETKTKFGLDIMHERAAQIGAQLEIKSAAGQGTRIEFHMPFKEGEKKNADEADAGR